MQHIDLNYDPNGDAKIADSHAHHSHTFRAQTTLNGSVEIVRTRKGVDTQIAVIPKEKRAELANFLVNAE